MDKLVIACIFFALGAITMRGVDDDLLREANQTIQQLQDKLKEQRPSVYFTHYKR